MKTKFVTRAANVMMLVEKDKPISILPNGETECKVFTLIDNKTGAMIRLDEHMLEFLYKEARYEVERAVS